jgi:hypothetical protein
MATYKEEAVEAAFARITAFPPDPNSDQYRYMQEALEAAEPFIAEYYEEKARKEVEGGLLGDEAVEAAAKEMWDGAHIEDDEAYWDEAVCLGMPGVVGARREARAALRAALASQEVER